MPFLCSFMRLKTILPTYIYYVIPCLFWGFLFFFFYGLYELCYYIDTFTWGVLYFINFVFAVCLAIKTYKSLLSLYGTRVNVKRVNEFHDFLYSLKCSFGVFGEQGVGKSLTMTYIIMLLCPERFFDLMYEYYRDLPVQDKLLEEAKSGNLFPWKLFKTKKESLDFYIKNIDEYLPCVYAFEEQTIKQNGRRSYPLKVGHFTMTERLPEKNMLAADEFGDRFNNAARRKDLTKTKLTDDEIRARIDLENTFKMASTHRQVSDGMIILADQRKGDISIAFKGTCAKKWYLVSLEERYNAEYILKKKEKLKAKIVRVGNLLEHPKLAGKEITEKERTKLSKKLVRLTKLDKFLSKIQSKIGFFKIGYCEELGSEEVSKIDKKNIKYFAMPRNLDYEFNSRGYLLTNPTIDKTLHV